MSASRIRNRFSFVFCRKGRQGINVAKRIQLGERRDRVGCVRGGRWVTYNRYDAVGAFGRMSHWQVLQID